MRFGRSRLVRVVERHPRPVVAVALLTVGVVAFLTRLPDPLFSSPRSAVLFGDDGSLLGGRIAADGQWRFPPAGVVPERFARAVIEYEDGRFRYHPGVDPLALARALVQDVRAGSVVSGGSTITMQVARMARGNRPRTVRQKVVEMLWAVRLELGRSKDEILALYADNAPFGGNVVGLEAAAWRYFGRGPDDLSWAEAAMLAVLPNSPALIHPGRNRDLLREKRDQLLAQLEAEGVIDGTALRLAVLEPLPAEPHPLPQLAPHLLQTLAENGGDASGRFVTTLSASVQRRVLASVEREARTLSDMGIRNAAVLVVDNRTFDVVAYVGNSRWSVDAGGGYAIDLVHRPRSTGSVLKPLLFARMLDAGELLPETLVPDVPTQYAGFMPENYDRTFRGAVPASEALARSLNVPAVRMLQQHGVARFYDFLRSMGMSTLHRAPDEYGLSLILGGSEGTLWDLTTMYANMAHIAVSPGEPRSVELLEPRVLAADEPERLGPARLSRGAAWLTIEALHEVVRPGDEAQWRYFEGAQRVAWKTGTSYGHRDAWAIGSTAGYTVGVWVGNADGEGRPEITGVGSAAPLLFDVFNGLESVPWGGRPISALRRVDVCRDDGYLPMLGCETVPAWAPRESHFERSSPYQRLLHLDPSGAWQVDGRCEDVGHMKHTSWFVLPPGQEFYYRRHHSGYRSPPPVRADCGAGDAPARPPMEFLYPNDGTRVYVPVDLGGERGRVVFALAHRDPESTVHWHLDDTFVTTTHLFHEVALDLPPGRHVLTAVDGEGNRIRKAFEVLAKGRAAGG